jgi:hypothetical protein
MATRPCSAFAAISAFPILLVEIPGDPAVLPFADVVHEQPHPITNPKFPLVC